MATVLNDGGFAAQLMSGGTRWLHQDGSETGGKMSKVKADVLGTEQILYPLVLVYCEFEPTSDALIVPKLTALVSIATNHLTFFLPVPVECRHITPRRISESSLNPLKTNIKSNSNYASLLLHFCTFFWEGIIQLNSIYKTWVRDVNALVAVGG